MRMTILLLILAGCLVGCKKKDYVDPNSYLCQTGCDWRPPQFYFIVADNKGQSLIFSDKEGIQASYMEKGQLTSVSGPSYAFKTLAGATTPFIFNMGGLSSISEGGIKTFYLVYQGKTDTLGLDVRAVTPITADNGGHSIPIVTFNGRPMQSVPGGTDTPDYYVLKRR